MFHQLQNAWTIVLTIVEQDQTHSAKAFDLIQNMLEDVMDSLAIYSSPIVRELVNVS